MFCKATYACNQQSPFYVFGLFLINLIKIMGLVLSKK